MKAQLEPIRIILVSKYGNNLNKYLIIDILYIHINFGDSKYCSFSSLSFNILPCNVHTVYENRKSL